ncbi:hypothetical protein GOODEAATRI_025369 [Goodea atripinnis]|uniref:Uncharacterized protein n=1 Tax=Goodea atripinnis TaxID=208336 RepID=A0ABV0P0B4_9TELE
MDRNQDRSESEVVLMETRRLISNLEALEEETQAWFSSQRRLHRRRQAVVLTGRHRLSDTEVGLHQRVLQQMDYEVHVSRFAESSSFLRTQQGKHTRVNRVSCHVTWVETSCPTAGNIQAKQLFMLYSPDKIQLTRRLLV